MAAVTSTGTSSGVFVPWLASKHWAGTSHTYSFPTDGSFFSYQSTNAVTPLSASQQTAVRAILAEIASFTGLSFVEVTETTTTEATFRFAKEVGLEGGYAYLPWGDDSAGDGFFGSGTINPVIGNEAYLYFTHEIGHAMGLNHGHEFPAFVSSGMDSQEFTVLTYSDYVGDTDTFSFDSGSVDWAQSYMQLDIAAMQFLYGANYASTGEVWSGDTVYTFNPNTGEMSVNGVGTGAPAGNRIFRTIWDGDGTDTYDLGSYTTDLQINLAPGEWSVFSSAQLADLNSFSTDPSFNARGNLANALLVEGDQRALIENVNGGTGDDTILGNRADNILRGNAGKDVLSGKFGADTLIGQAGKDILNGGSGNDRLEGGGQNDRLLGHTGRDLLLGGKGGDRLFGGNAVDLLFGKAGNDILIGGGGNDGLIGGTGADIFRFKSASDSASATTGDEILGFVSGVDRIDLSPMAATRFILSLGGEFSGSGPSAYTQTVSGDTLVFADVDGDGSADFRITLLDVTTLTTGDFIL